MILIHRTKVSKEEEITVSKLNQYKIDLNIKLHNINNHN